MGLRVLVGSDRRAYLQDLEMLLAAEGCEVFCAPDADRARELADLSAPDVIFWGLEDAAEGPTAAGIARNLTGVYLVALVASAAMGSPDAERPAGGGESPLFADALPLPCSQAELRGVLRRAAAWCRLHRQLRVLERERTRRAAARPIVAASPAMIELLEAVERAAGFRACVLLHGEPGSGKEGLARAIHAQSDRRGGPFVSVHCGSPDAASLQAELFGRPAGAEPASPGCVADAHGGTLFLEDVEALPAACQERLLAAIQAEALTAPGAAKPRPIDVRVISASARARGTAPVPDAFLDELWTRLTAVELRVPPLRERVEDIPLLVDHIGARASRSLALPRPTVGDDALERLVRYAWPGNIRELEEVIGRAVLLARGGRIGARELPDGLEPGAPSHHDLALRPARKRLEMQLIRRALQQTRGNRTHAAKLLRISHRALLYKLKEHGINR